MSVSCCARAALLEPPDRSHHFASATLELIANHLRHETNVLHDESTKAAQRVRSRHAQGCAFSPLSLTATPAWASLALGAAGPLGRFGRSALFEANTLRCRETFMQGGKYLRFAERSCEAVPIEISTEELIDARNN